MGKQSIFKAAYDQYAKDYFIQQGWESNVVKKGGRLCDVIAVRDNTAAVIEVKSPAEGSVDKKWDDTKKLSSALFEKFGIIFGILRRVITEDIQNEQGGLGINLVKLYAVTVACQLYRYVHEYNNKKPEYKKAIGDRIFIDQMRLQIEPYLVIPIEAKDQGNASLNYLQREGIVRCYKPFQDSRLYIVRVVYAE
jgi:hypothetical protein